MNVAGSNPVSRSFFYGGVAKWLRQRSAKPLFSGSNPLAASTSAGMAELVDARDLKSLVLFGRAGSIPAPGTKKPREGHCACLPVGFFTDMNGFF